MSKNKKPTMMQMKNVVSNIINHINEIEKKVSRLDLFILKYVQFKDEENQFSEWLKKDVAKIKKDKEQLYGEYDEGEK